jgi:hypothetical protein
MKPYVKLFALALFLVLAGVTAYATVSTETNRVDATGNGTATAYTYTFKITDKTHLKVYVNGTLQTVDSDYTVSGVGSDSGGTVTFTTAPASGRRVIILREVPLTQSTTYTNSGKFPAASHEATLDKLTMAIQQLKERLDRAPVLTVPNSPGLTPLALPASSPSAYIRWNSAGSALESATVLSGQTITLPLGTTEGGTGLNSAPANGDFLIGNASGGYTLSNATTARTALGVTSATDVISNTIMDAKGDLIAGSGSDTPVRIASGGNGTMLRATSGTTTGLEWGAPAGYIWGLMLSNNLARVATDVDISIGEASSSSTNHASRAILTLNAALTKKFDATWAVGNNQGGRTSSKAVASGVWHVCLIRVAGVEDAGFDTSATCSNLVTDHSATHVRRIGSILREGSGNVTFTQVDDIFMRATPVLDTSATNPGTGAVTRTLSVATGVNVTAVLNVAVTQSGTNSYAYLSPLSVGDATPSATTAPLFSMLGSNTSTANWGIGPVNILTNTSGQIRSRLSASDANTVLRISTLGWVDTRGRLN